MKKLLFFALIFFPLFSLAQYPDGRPRTVDNSIPIPEPLPASDITDKGFTANWKNYDYLLGDELGFDVYVYATKTMTEEDSVFYYIKTDFNEYFQNGSIEAPVEQKVYGGIDPGRFGWNASVYSSAGGVLCLDNSKQFGRDGYIISPLLDLGQGDGKVHMKMKAKGKNATDFVVILFSHDVSADIQVFPLTEEWAEYDITLNGGCEDSFISIEMAKNSSGKMFIDDFEVSQVLPPSATPLAISIWWYTFKQNSSSTYIETPYKILYEGERLAYKVDACIYRRNTYPEFLASEMSDLIYVTPQPSTILLRPITPNSHNSYHYDLQGRPLTPSTQQRGLTIQNTSKILCH